MGQQVDPTLFAVDQLLRLLALGVIQMIPWMCALVPLAYLHAKWSKGK